MVILINYLEIRGLLKVKEGNLPSKKLLYLYRRMESLIMFPKCFNCSNNLSLSWYLGAFMLTKHRCVKCSQLHEFTNLRRFFNGLVFVGILFITPFLESYIQTRFLLGISLLFIILSIIPGQHRLSSNEDVGVK